MNPRIRHALIIALVISLLLHILVMLGIIFIHIPMPLTSQTPIEVFDAQGMNIADTNIPPNRQVPKTARAVGMENNAVTQETVARPTRPQSPQPRSQRSASGVAKSSQQPRSQLNPSNRFKQPSRSFSSKSLYAVDPSLFAMKSPEQADTSANTLGTNRGRARSGRSAMAYDMSGAGGLPLSDDYLPDYQYGDHTYVNIFRHPDVEYFVMLKRIFRQTWNPEPPVRMSISAGYQLVLPLRVVLAVAVSPQGALSELFILKRSGMPAYDEEALRTVRASSPFSSPPAKLLKDGSVRMAWSFILY